MTYCILDLERPCNKEALSEYISEGIEIGAVKLSESLNKKEIVEVKGESVMTIKQQKNENNDVAIIGNLACEKTAIVQNIHASNGKLYDLSNELEQLGKQRANCTPASTGGYAAELHHKYTFEADALRKGRTNIVAELGPRGGYGSKGTADLSIIDNGKKMSEAGLKYRSKATETTFDQSNVFDQGRQKICPSDQVDRVKELSAKRADTGTLKAKEYADTSQNATDRLKYVDVESQPLSKSDSIEIVSDSSRYSKQAFRNDLRVSIKGGAIGGAASSCVISIVSNTIACTKGDKEVGDAVVDVAKVTTEGAVKGATIGAGSQIVKRMMIKAGAESLAKGSVPVAIASTALDAGIGIVKEATKMINGEQDVTEFTIKSVGHTAAAATKGGAAFAGAELGAAFGAAGGPAGIFLGGIIGGTVGFIVGDNVVNSIKDFFGW